MPRSYRATVLTALTVLVVGAGCAAKGSDGADQTSVKAVFVRGLEQIRGTRDRKTLRRQLVRTVARLRAKRPASAAARRGRALAVRGFESTRKGVQAYIDFYENDSGNLPVATRDALRGDRALRKGATLLRAAGRALGVRVGSLNGY